MFEWGQISADYEKLSYCPNRGAVGPCCSALMRQLHGVQHNIVHGVQHNIVHGVQHNIVHRVQHNIVHRVQHNIVHGVQHNIKLT